MARYLTTPTETEIKPWPPKPAFPLSTKPPDSARLLRLH